MALSVIGAGFGRTGTASMKLALEALGLGPCHHMKEVLASPGQIALWRAAARGRTPDWDAAFAGYSSAVDWPAAFFWRELSAHYGEAKILLTVRDAGDWYASMEKTIFKTLETSTEPASIGLKLIGERVFAGRWGDRDHVIEVYEKNTADVQAAFGADRLLTCNPGDGWPPLCDFLEKPVPDTPYPHSNTAGEFNAMIEAMRGNDEA